MKTAHEVSATAGAGAPLGGSAASGPGTGGGGGGAAPLNLGGDGGPGGNSGRNPNSVSGIPLGKRPQKKSYNSAPVKYQPISTSDESSTDNSDMFYLAPLTTEQILFNEIAGQIALYEPTPYGEAVVGAVNLIFLVYNNAPTLEMSRYKPGMQGGGQNVRDKGLKGFPDGFRKWLHKQKENGAPDFNNKEVWELYKQWVEEGCPVPYK